MEQQARDLQAALEFVLAEGYTNVGLVGESLGGTIALLGYDSKYKAVALWWPAIYLMDTSLTCYLTEEMLAELAQKGYILDGDTKVGKSFIDEFQQVDLEPYVRKLQNPVLLVHGDEDQEVPYQQSVKALELINTTRQLLILQGGDHGLRKPQEQAEVIEVSLAWFKKYLL
jgi:dipeptidyl aminopeptidase/acylaminoacyl peptidase